MVLHLNSMLLSFNNEKILKGKTAGESKNRPVNKVFLTEDLKGKRKTMVELRVLMWEKSTVVN